MRKMIRTLDLFCGAGGSSYGARLANATIVAGVDKWEQAQKVYEANFPEAEFFPEDIFQLQPAWLKEKIGDIDLILASPECTNHSKAKGKSETCEKGEKSRETAIRVLDFVREFSPTWVVIENVEEMKGWVRHQEILDSLEAMDYQVNHQAILDSSHFMVPQSRRRLFIIASKMKYPITPPYRNGYYPPASQILDKTSKYQFTPLDKIGRAQATLNKAYKAINTLGNNKPFLIVYYGSAKDGNNGGWQTLDRPLRTITTLDRFAYVVPGENGHKMRMLQPEELKLAMGYGPEFKLDVVEGLSRRDRVKLMGNGVCPPVMKAIVESLIVEAYE